MQAFTIDERKKIVEPLIRLMSTGRGFSVQVGSELIMVGSRDQDEIVLRRPHPHIHYVGLTETSSGIIISAPFLRRISGLSPEETKAAYTRFDQTALVLWQTGDRNCHTDSDSSAKIIAHDKSSLLIEFRPQSAVSAQINRRRIVLFWTGHEFMWL